MGSDRAEAAPGGVLIGPPSAATGRLALYFAGEDAESLSPLIDKAADRFNQQLGLEEEKKIDFKIKARQFVKVYGQMASILPLEVVDS